MAHNDNHEHRALDAAYLEQGSMLGARRRHESHMDTTPSASTAAIYTMASWRASDTQVYMLSELQRALLLHHLAIALCSDDNIGTTAESVAKVLQRITGDTDTSAARGVLEAFIKSHRGRFSWSLVPMDVTQWVDMCLPWDLRDMCGHTLVEHLFDAAAGVCDWCFGSWYPHPSHAAG